jgi:hypothetical protein
VFLREVRWSLRAETWAHGNDEPAAPTSQVPQSTTWTRGEEPRSRLVQHAASILIESFKASFWRPTSQYIVRHISTGRRYLDYLGYRFGKSSEEEVFVDVTACPYGEPIVESRDGRGRPGLCNCPLVSQAVIDSPVSAAPALGR